MSSVAIARRKGIADDHRQDADHHGPHAGRDESFPAYAVVKGMSLRLRKHQDEQEGYQDRAGVNHDRGYAQECAP